MADSAGTIIITCSCGQKMKVPSEAVGKTASCVKCGEKVPIRGEAPAAPEAAPASPPPAEPPPRSSDTPAQTDEPGLPDGISAIEALKAIGLLDDAGLAEVELIQKDLPWADWEAVVETGHVTPEDFYALMAKHCAVRKIDLKNYHIPHDAVDFVSEELVKEGVLFPVDKLGKMLTIAMACPMDRAMIDKIAQVTGFKVKVLLAPLADLRETIRYHYPTRHGQISYSDAFTKELHNEFNDEIVGSVLFERMFSADPPKGMTTTIDALQSAAADGAEALQKIHSIIASDPVTGLTVLSAANSAAYGFPMRVDNIAMALTVLGPEATAKLTKTMPSEDYFALVGQFDFKAFWKRSQFCANAAGKIAEKFDMQRVLTAYTAGLFHAVGRLPLCAALPNSYAKLTQGISGTELLELENRLFGTNHAMSGYLLTRKLNLPRGITEPVRYHRDFAQATKSTEITAAVALAAIMADAMENSSALNLDAEIPLLDKLRLAPADTEAIFQAVLSEIPS